MGSLKSNYIDVFYTELNKDRKGFTPEDLHFRGAIATMHTESNETSGQTGNNDEAYYSRKFIGKYEYKYPMFSCRGAGDFRDCCSGDFPTTGAGGGPYPAEYIAEKEKRWEEND